MDKVTGRCQKEEYIKYVYTEIKRGNDTSNKYYITTNVIVARSVIKRFNFQYYISVPNYIERK